MRIAIRPRSFVRVSGPAAEDYLDRMVSNDVAALGPGESCEALLLTAKARVIAPLVVLRRGPQDFLLSTEPGLGERVLGELRRLRFAAKVELEPEHHDATVVFTEARPEGLAYPVPDYGEPAWEVLDATRDGEPVDAASLELLRIRAGTPRAGSELDDRVLPAEAGLTATHVSFTKGCYPGQEPVARLHYRGHANRGLRVLRIEADEPPAHDAELTYEGKPVGRVTSAARDPEGGVLALAYVRREVPGDAVLAVGTSIARPLH
jgi:folate-binding protein YgfZ